MKKGIIVLLITVLAAGMAFATFTGSASIDFGVSLDKQGWGFENSPSIDEYSFTFALDTQSAAVGAERQTDIWAELEATASGAIELEKGKDSPAFSVEAEITTANIHVYDFTIGILGPKSAYNYASSWTNSGYPYYTPNYDFANNSRIGKTFNHSAGGFNVSYQGYTVSLAVNNEYTGAVADVAEANVEPKWFKDDDAATAAGYDPSAKIIGYENGATAAAYGAWYYKTAEKTGSPASETLTVFANAETKAFELAEGMTLQAAANFLLVGKDNKPYVGGAVKYAYAADKLTVGVASDFQFDANKEVVALDARADVKYDIVTGNVYFGSDKLGKEGAKYILEAKVGASIPVAENVTLKVAGEVDKLDLSKKADAFKSAEYTASVGTTVDKLTANASFGYNAVLDKINDGADKITGIKVAADVTYAADAFTAKAGISVGMIKNAADKFVLYNVKPSASVSSTAIVEGAELSIGYAGANLLAEDYKANDTYSKGSITASATIEF